MFPVAVWAADRFLFKLAGFVVFSVGPAAVRAFGQLRFELAGFVVVFPGPATVWVVDRFKLEVVVVVAGRFLFSSGWEWRNAGHHSHQLARMALGQLVVCWGILIPYPYFYKAGDCLSNSTDQLTRVSVQGGPNNLAAG